MDLIVSLILVFIVGFFASFISSMVGSGGLVCIPFLVFLGLPPEVAIATNKFGSIGLRVGALYKFWKEKKIVWKYVVPFSIIALIGVSIGANILINTDREILSKIVGYALLLLIPTILFKKEVGTKKKEVTKTRKNIGYFLYLLVAIWAGFFGGGSGTLFFYVLITLFGLTMIEATATTKIPGIISTILALIIFAVNGIINYLYGGVLLVGMFIGGYLGAHTAVKKGNSWVKGLFILIVLASAVKLIFF